MSGESSWWPASLSPWLPDELYQRVAAAARQVGTERLKPIFIALGEQVSYEDIRVVVSHLNAGESAPEEPIRSRAISLPWRGRR